MVISVKIIYPVYMDIKSEKNDIPDIIELEIDSLAYKGSGVGRYEGAVCFVPFTAPGDLARVKITDRQKSFYRGEVIDIIKPSPYRKEALCGYFGRCGGCSWQHIDYSRQLYEKTSILTQSISRIAGFTPEIKEIIRSPLEYNYRNSVRFKYDKNGDIGFYSAGSHHHITIERCEIINEAFNSCLTGLNHRFDNHPEKPDEIELVLNSDGTISEYPLFRGKQADSGFMQVNNKVNDLMKKCIRGLAADYLEETGSLSILDLFCGDGNLSMPLSDIACRIRGYDISEASIKRGSQRASGNKDITYRRTSIKKLLRKETLKNKAADCLITDPPRDGLKGIADEIASLDIPMIIYISCVPPVLARDLKTFRNRGYELKFLQPFDMFPQTYHLETLAVLRK